MGQPNRWPIARVIHTGDTPATKGGSGKWRDSPHTNTSASAIAVVRRAAGVAPAAEIPGTRPVSVNPTMLTKAGIFAGIPANHCRPRSAPAAMTTPVPTGLPIGFP
jgi:hypothetical protein